MYISIYTKYLEKTGQMPPNSRALNTSSTHHLTKSVYILVLIQSFLIT